MTTQNRTELDRAELKEVVALCSTLNECSDELLKLIKRRHPSLYQAQFLLRQANVKIATLFQRLERVTVNKEPNP